LPGFKYPSIADSSVGSLRIVNGVFTVPVISAIAETGVTVDAISGTCVPGTGLICNGVANPQAHIARTDTTRPI